MHWKIVSGLLGILLIGILWGTFVFPRYEVNTVAASPPLQSPTGGRASIGAIPRIINFQGLLKDPDTGSAIEDGSKSVVFSFYTSSTGGTAVWQETQTIQTSNGQFRTILGQTSRINPSIIAIPQLWLGVRLPPDIEMTPRQLIAGSVYSVGATEAQVADSVGATPRQIALRQWYKGDRVRGPRHDVAYVAAKNIPHSQAGWDSIKDRELHSMVSRSIGEITYSWGHHLNPGTDGDREHHAGLNGSFLHKCTDLKVVGPLLLCMAPNQFFLFSYVGHFEGSYPFPRYENLACPGCTRVTFDGTNLWASSPANNAVYKIDLTREYEEEDGFSGYPNPKAPAIVATIGVGGNPMDIEFDGSQVWVANQADDTVSAINVSDSTVVATVAVGDSPEVLIFDGQSLWVLNVGSETVTKIDVESQSVTGTYNVGSGPTDLSFDGSSVWVANGDDQTISILRNTDGSLEETISVAGKPTILQFDGLGTWVATWELQPDMLAPCTNCSPGTKILISGYRWILTRY